MKLGRIGIAAVLVVSAVFVLAACGGGPTPTPRPTATPAPTPVPGQTPAPEPTATPAPGFDAEAYFRGKTVQFVVGFTPGGGYDTSARAFAAVASRHFPGSPRFVVENRPGSGGELVFGVVNNRPANGLSASNMHPRFMKRELLGVDVPHFDLNTVKWVGAPTSVIVSSAYYTRCSIAETWQDVLNLGRPVSEGATAPGDTGSLGSSFVALLGGPVRLVYGYGGTSEIMAAFDRGELDGTNRGNYTQAPRLFPEWVANRTICPVIRWGADPTDDPAFVDYVTNQLGREIPPHVFEVTNANDGEQAVYTASEVVNEMLSRAVWMHPDTPDHLHSVWVEAFRATVADPQFIEIMTAAGFEVGYLSPEDATRYLREASETLAGDAQLRELFSELAGGTN